MGGREVQERREGGTNLCSQKTITALEAVLYVSHRKSVEILEAVVRVGYCTQIKGGWCAASPVPKSDIHLGGIDCIFLHNIEKRTDT